MNAPASSTSDASTPNPAIAAAPISARTAIYFLALIVGGLAVDLWSKNWIFGALKMPGENPPIWLWEGVFGLRTSLNEGALFGLGQGHGLIFIALSVAAVIGIFYWVFAAGAGRDLWLTTALGLITAGTLGNLYDRLGLHGLKWHFSNGRGHELGDAVYAVRDWLDFALINWPIFNIADSMLVCGAAVLLLHAVLFAEPQAAGSGSTSPSSVNHGSSATLSDAEMSMSRSGT
ncbi:MAG TPA: signal peptidase II [Pirellulales bacterium]